MEATAKAGWPRVFGSCSCGEWGTRHGTARRSPPTSTDLEKDGQLRATYSPFAGQPKQALAATLVNPQSLRADVRGCRCNRLSALQQQIGVARKPASTASTLPSCGGVVERLIAAGQWRSGDPDMLIVTDAGYDVTRLAYVLRDLPVELLGRIRSDRVLRLPAPPRRYDPKGGRPPKHGEFALADSATWPEPAVTTATDTTHYGKAEASAWDRLHPRLTHRAAWLDHEGELPIIEGTLIRLKVEYLPSGRDAPPVWLWSSKTGATGADVDRYWQAFLRRFDLEHTYRFWKQTLGWTRPKLRAAQAADRWTWLLVIAHTQLRLARRLTEDLHHPWEQPAPPGQLTPARVRRGFRNLRPALAQPAAQRH
ncbi:transposase [Nonomuraea sp. NPDC046570]|uniref:transposase n=1 Tax=Nonomuraea sp. NPDC046570 TaxID=3155255 RepID=UPI0033CCAE5A